MQLKPAAQTTVFKIKHNTIQRYIIWYLHAGQEWEESSKILLFIIKPICFNRAEISVCRVKTLKYAIAWSEVFQVEFAGCAWCDNRDSVMCTHCMLRIKATVSQAEDSVMCSHCMLRIKASVSRDAAWVNVARAHWIYCEIDFVLIWGYCVLRNVQVLLKCSLQLWQLHVKWSHKVVMTWSLKNQKFFKVCVCYYIHMNVLRVKFRRGHWIPWRYSLLWATPCGNWELNSDPLQKQYALLAAEKSPWFCALSWKLDSRFCLLPPQAKPDLFAMLLPGQGKSEGVGVGLNISSGLGWNFW